MKRQLQPPSNKKWKKEKMDTMDALSGVWFNLIFFFILKKWVAGLGCPCGLEDKAIWTSSILNFWGFTDSTSQQTRNLKSFDTIQATSLLSRNSFGKGRFVKKNPVKSQAYFM